MSDRRSTAALLVAFTVLNLVAVAVLALAYGWPAILDEPAAVVLPAFAAAQPAVVAGFLLQTLLSIALVPISIGLHRETGGGSRLWPLTVATVGVLSGLTQTLGWIRWPVVVPGLAATWLDPATPADTRVATEVAYDLLNSYAGGALGEYLGWLFQALWAVGIAALLLRARVVGPLTTSIGIGLTALWGSSFLVGPFAPVLADGPFATAAFAAYALWFLWLGAVGLVLLRTARTPGRCPVTAVVLGAGGGIGSHTVEALLARGWNVRAVTRTAVDLPDGAEPHLADLRDPDAVAGAVAGADLVVHAAQPAYTRWTQEFPSLTAAIADAAEGTRLVFADNLYGYGPVTGRLTEDLPAAAGDRKGRVRAAMAADLLRRHADGRLQVVIGRASDYFGPRGTATTAGDTMVPAAIAGRPVRVLGRPDVPHSWSYLPDVGRALAMLAEAPPGRVYHLPVGPPCSQQDLADAFARAAGHERARVSALPSPLHRALALVNPMLRELLETRYQFTDPFVVDDSRFHREVGPFTPTGLAEAAAATVAWFRGREP